MNTIRKFVDVKNNSIIVDLPDNFKAKRVEVIASEFAKREDLDFSERD